MAKTNNELLTRLDSIERLLQAQTRQPLTFGEAVLYLHISKSYLYKLTSTGEIAHFKPNGKLIYFLKGELDDWITRNRVSSQSELEADAIERMQARERGKR